jgi:hypothetical protein
MGRVTASSRGRFAGVSAEEAAAYEPHALHGPGRAYLETNCYTDIIIELLHAMGHEPLAAFGHFARADFEGDQWTFLKPPPEDLETLFGIDIHEMQPYRPIPLQLAEQLSEGRTMIVELDAWYLPDAVTSYRSEHVKTSVAVAAVDVERQTLRYFHGPGLYELAGEDFRGAFRIGGAFSEDVLPPYAELVRCDAGPPLEAPALRLAARDLLRSHLARRPKDNPFERFATRLVSDLAELQDRGLAAYHAYAFATVRMAGSAFEVGGSHVEWLLGEDAQRPADALREIVDGCKVLGFKLARRREFDVEPLATSLGDAWWLAMESLDEAMAS